MILLSQIWQAINIVLCRKLIIQTPVTCYHMPASTNYYFKNRNANGQNKLHIRKAPKRTRQKKETGGKAPAKACSTERAVPE
jgi:hypothetical protein